MSKYLQLEKQFSTATDELDSHQLQEQRAVGIRQQVLRILPMHSTGCKLSISVWMVHQICLGVASQKLPSFQCLYSELVNLSWLLPSDCRQDACSDADP